MLSQTHPLSPVPLTTDPNPNPKPNQVLLLLAFTTPMALLIWVGVFAELTVGLIKLAEGRQGASGPTEDLVDFGVLLLLQLMNALVCVDACAPGPAYCAYRPPACRARLRHGAAEARGSWRATVRTPYAYKPRPYRVPRTAYRGTNPGPRRLARRVQGGRRRGRAQEEPRPPRQREAQRPVDRGQGTGAGTTSLWLYSS